MQAVLEDYQRDFTGLSCLHSVDPSKVRLYKCLKKVALFSEKVKRLLSYCEALDWKECKKAILFNANQLDPGSIMYMPSSGSGSLLVFNEICTDGDIAKLKKLVLLLEQDVAYLKSICEVD